MTMAREPEVDAAQMALRLKVHVVGQSETIGVYGYVPILYLAGIKAHGASFVLNRTEIRAQSFEEFTLEVPLTPLLLKRIEDVRNGGDVDLSVNLSLLTQRTPRANEVGLGTTSIGLLQSYKISERQWLKLLDQLGYGSTAVFEVRTPPLPAFAPLEDVSEHMADAVRSLAEGDNEDAVTRCRKALEALNELVSKRTGDDSCMEPKLAEAVDFGSAGQPGRPPKSARIEAARRSLWQILHIGPHKGYRVTRADAEYCVHATLSLVAYYARQLAELAAPRGE